MKKLITVFALLFVSNTVFANACVPPSPYGNSTWPVKFEGVVYKIDVVDEPWWFTGAVRVSKDGQQLGDTWRINSASGGCGFTAVRTLTVEGNYKFKLSRFQGQFGGYTWKSELYYGNSRLSKMGTMN